VTLAAALLYREGAAPLSPQQVAATATNRSATLPDGSKVILGAKTLVTVDFTGLKRNLDLSAGEAYFKVKHDQRHPFTVHAGDIEVTAVGTAFDVRREGDKTTVTVEEGAVDVSSSPGHASWRAEAGYQLTVIQVNTIRPPSPVSTPQEHLSGGTASSPTSASRWVPSSKTSKPLLFPENRHPRQGRRGAPLQITGTAFTAGVDDWLKAIQEAYPVEAQNSPNGDIVLTERK